MWWKWVIAVLTAGGSTGGSVLALRMLVKHEQQACDARMDAFKEGLDRHEHEH